MCRCLLAYIIYIYLHKMNNSNIYIYRYRYMHLMCIYACIYIWANYNNSQTWNKAIWGWFPLITMIPVRSQWGRYNLPRYMQITRYREKICRHKDTQLWNPSTYSSCTSQPRWPCPGLLCHLRRTDMIFKDLSSTWDPVEFSVVDIHSVRTWKWP